MLVLFQIIIKLVKFRMQLLIVAIQGLEGLGRGSKLYQQNCRAS